MESDRKNKSDGRREDPDRSILVKLSPHETAQELQSDGCVKMSQDASQPNSMNCKSIEDVQISENVMFSQ